LLALAILHAYKVETRLKILSKKVILKFLAIMEITKKVQGYLWTN
jgi:hypothetical protein